MSRLHCFWQPGLIGFGAQTALVVQKVLNIALFAVLGDRAGWVLDHCLVPTILGALFVDGIGVLLAVVKYVSHCL